MSKYKNKYRVESARAKWWDYGWNGAYFITICTKNRAHIYGEIINGKMILSQKGIIADLLWHEIPNHFPVVELGDFVVMPNHIHGILILDNPVSVPQPSEPHTKNEKMAAISPKSNTISTIIRSYKSAVTRHGNRLGLKNGWQERFHDHIIRNDAEYQRISNYIVNNPAKWESDSLR